MEKKLIEDENLRLIIFESANELGSKVDEKLLKMYHKDTLKDTFILPIKENFFEDGHQKVELGSGETNTVRGKDLFFLTDIGNYSLTYNMHGYENHTSPNDLFVQLKDGIGACNRHTKDINIIMPLLYNGRQHRRNTRECLSCGLSLHELESLNIKSFITFDAHDQGVEHALHNVEFDNFFATNAILESLIKDLTKKDLQNIVFVAPDNGATGRRNVYLNSFDAPGVHREAGSFVKVRSYDHLVDGKYPIVSHDYSGNANLEGYTAIVCDDMISSGNSMFDVITEIKKKGVSKIYLVTTYALFTRGIDKFQEFYNNKILNGLYTTNLSYIPKEYQKEKWLHVCDCSTLIAEIIYKMHNNESISKILRDKSEPIELLKEKLGTK